MSDQKIIRLLFYIPRFGDGHALDNAIYLWTKIWNRKAPTMLRCSHAEIWTPGYEMGFTWQDKQGKHQFAGDCWTSTMRGEDNGTVRRAAADILKHPDRWFYFEIEVREYERLYESMERKVKFNQGYDVWTIMSFFWVRRYTSRPGQICSEFSHEALLGFPSNMRLRVALAHLTCPSPLRLAYTVFRAGHVPHFLKDELSTKEA
jgi:hypothetical protein